MQVVLLAILVRYIGLFTDFVLIWLLGFSHFLRVWFDPIDMTGNKPTRLDRNRDSFEFKNQDELRRPRRSLITLI